MAKKVALYLRVSTVEQDTTNQRRELEAVAERHGWEIVTIFEDNGVSGFKTKRPGLDQLMKAVSRREIEMVMAWSVDRLGRSLQGLLDVLTELRAKKVDLYLHVQGVDTSTPSGKAMFQMLGVFSEFEREMIRGQSQVAGQALRQAQDYSRGRKGHHGHAEGWHGHDQDGQDARRGRWNGAEARPCDVTSVMSPRYEKPVM